jgi:hypothetical protein
MEADDFKSDGVGVIPLNENFDEDMKKTGNKLPKSGKEVRIVSVCHSSFYPFFPSLEL